MTPFKTNTDLTLSIPSSWQEVTCKMYYQMNIYKESLSDIVQIVSILSGLDYDTIFNLPEHKILNTIAPHLNWVNEVFRPDELPVPDSIVLQGKTVKIPKDIKALSWGQRIVCENLIKPKLESNQDAFEFLPLICSIYLSPLYYEKEFAADKIEEFEDMIWNAPIKDIYPVGGFFLRSSTKLLKLKMKRLNPRPSKNLKKPVLTG